jgi:hypothetical protein
MTNVRLEAGRHFRKNEMEYLKKKVDITMQDCGI